MQDLRIAAVQMNCRVAERDRNLATIERLAEAAAAQDVDIVCFPELCVCGYNAGDTSTPEPEPLEGESLRRLECVGASGEPQGDADVLSPLPPARDVPALGERD